MTCLTNADFFVPSAGDTRRPHRARPHRQETQHRSTAQDLAVLRRERIQVCVLVTGLLREHDVEHNSVHVTESKYYFCASCE